MIVIRHKADGRREETKVAAAPPQAAERPPCRHRGDQVGEVLCVVCGAEKGTMVPVFACALHETCTLRRYTTYPHPEARCNDCDDYDPEDPTP